MLVQKKLVKMCKNVSVRAAAGKNLIGDLFGVFCFVLFFVASVILTISHADIVLTTLKQSH